MTTPSVFDLQPGDPPPGEITRLPGNLPLTLDAASTAALTSTERSPAAGIAEVRITPSTRAIVRVGWRLPCVDAVAYWTPDSDRSRGLPPFWGRPRTASLVRSAPVGCLVGVRDVALCTFAVGEVVRPVRIRAGVVEETGEFACWVEHEADPDLGLLLRIDVSGRAFSHSLADVAQWWRSELQAHKEVPRSARLPAYSTWYAAHQYVDEPGIEGQAEAAGDLGCAAIIVDDGWHSADRARGYGYVGEWDPNPRTFPDMADHVARVHEHGLAYLLWYALPFVGRHTALWERVRPYTLAYKDNLDAGVLDPRYPHVRDLLTQKLSRPFLEWGMDGLKLDFLDQFDVEDAPRPRPEADCDTVVEGVRRLLERLGGLLPRHALVELRQPYVSPGLWPYATMIRASDCPLSPLQNRLRTVDLRLLAGPLAVHADMMMWHPTERPEQVAVQLLNVLFAVPQISVDLTAQTPEQLAVLRFWLGFGSGQVEVLQHGRFEANRPDLHYPLVRAIGERTVIAGRYAPVPVPVDPDRELLLANADESTAVHLSIPRPWTAEATVRDCRGRQVDRQRLEADGTGLPTIAVPTGGLLELRPDLSNRP